jgi:hypothetical protein
LPRSACNTAACLKQQAAKPTFNQRGGATHVAEQLQHCAVQLSEEAPNWLRCQPTPAAGVANTTGTTTKSNSHSRWLCGHQQLAYLAVWHTSLPEVVIQHLFALQSMAMKSHHSPAKHCQQNTQQCWLSVTWQ